MTQATIGICGKCNRTLRNPASVKRGFGPACWRKVQAEAQPVQLAIENTVEGAGISSLKQEATA